jgi:hypothetical protein
MLFTKSLLFDFQSDNKSHNGLQNYNANNLQPMMMLKQKYAALPERQLSKSNTKQSRYFLQNWSNFRNDNTDLTNCSFYCTYDRMKVFVVLASTVWEDIVTFTLRLSFALDI